MDDVNEDEYRRVPYGWPDDLNLRVTAARWVRLARGDQLRYLLVKLEGSGDREYQMTDAGPGKAEVLELQNIQTRIVGLTFGEAQGHFEKQYGRNDTRDKYDRLIAEAKTRKLKKWENKELKILEVYLGIKVIA